ncbi:Myo-inositol 2-dehydrogenase [Baekduia alba]|uniref:inositol 2-dehydrogenase n=1 Tax=Baekduia alba TaxID=2997333 RepID=UPI0023407C57|nr:inositol 2-dehydrogenase [Baekduia alba]WCB96486.1 Myo-inositol 2-dehydrogenase [Baekduia alba]
MSDGAAVRIGILGLGRIGTLHAELLARRVAGARVTRVFDVDGARAAAVGAALDVVVAGSATALLEADDVDAVAICTSTDTHAALIEAAARAGKAIFCEKPVSLDLAAVDAALDAVVDASLTFQIGFNRRFDPAHAAVRRAVADGVVGAPQLVRVTSRDPAPPPLSYAATSGGLFLDMTIHDFDMARFVTGSEVVRVSAFGAARVVPELAELGDVDTAVVVLEHADGCLTTIDNARQAAYGYDQRVEVHGALGMATSENPPAHTGSVRTANGTASSVLPHFFLERYAAAFAAQWDAFVAACRDGGPGSPGVADARAPLAIGLAALRSRAERRPVDLAEVDPPPLSRPLTTSPTQ